MFLQKRVYQSSCDYSLLESEMYSFGIAHVMTPVILVTVTTLTTRIIREAIPRSTIITTFLLTKVDTLCEREGLFDNGGVARVVRSSAKVFPSIWKPIL